MKKLLFILFFIALLGFVVFLVTFLFTSITILFILFFIFLLFAIIFVFCFCFFDRVRMFFERTKAKKYIELKKNKEQELTELGTLFFKRKISEENFSKSKDSLESEILNLDSKIQISSALAINTEQELKDKIRLLTRKYLLKKISEDLFQELYIKYSKELAVLNSEKINYELDRKIKRELIKLKRDAKNKSK